MDVETSTPKTQGFLNNVKRIRVSRGLRISRQAKPMDKRLIFRYLYERFDRRDGGMARAPADGIAG